MSLNARAVFFCVLAGAVGLTRAAGAAGAADAGVRVDCPDLGREPAAEIESRVRASLLSSDSAASVTVACQGDLAEVRVESELGTATVAVKTTREAFRDEVLRAVDEALQQLKARPTGNSVPTANTSADTNTPAQPESVARVRPEPAHLVPPPAPVAAVILPPPRFEVSSSVLIESWPQRFALGASIAAGRATPAFWYAAKIAWLQPTPVPPSFDASELSFAGELGVAPPALRGVRVALGAGPSFLFIAPRGALVSRADESITSFFLAAQLSRPFWFGQVGVVPALGARYLTSERGVRVETRERLSLRGLLPQFGLGVSATL